MLERALSIADCSSAYASGSVAANGVTELFERAHNAQEQDIYEHAAGGRPA